MSAEAKACNWIVLPPLPNRQDWVARLQEAASAAGYVLQDWDQDQTPGDADKPLLMTTSADEALGRQPDASRIAGIVDALDVNVPEGTDQADRHRIVHGATQNFAQLAALPQARVFDAQRLAGTPLRLFSDLTVTAPEGTRRPDGPMSGALQLYTRDKAIWPGGVLTWLKTPTHAGGFATLDLTGRPRAIVYGPYFDMPKGRWKVVFTLSVDDHACRYLFRADWGGMEDFASQEFRPGRPGVFEVEMTYDWTTRGICEFRLLVMEGVFHGRISLSDLVISRAD